MFDREHNIHLVCINLMYASDLKLKFIMLKFNIFLFYFSYFIIVINRILHYVTACKMYILISTLSTAGIFVMVLITLMDDSFYIYTTFGKKTAHFFMEIFLE